MLYSTNYCYKYIEYKENSSILIRVKAKNSKLIKKTKVKNYSTF